MGTPCRTMTFWNSIEGIPVGKGVIYHNVLGKWIVELFPSIDIRYVSRLGGQN